jgi:PPP family 3-phenylpropionic acid transporter
MLLTALACLWLKRQVSRAHLEPVSRTLERPDWKALFAQKSLLVAIAAASFIQLSHTLYFSTASIGWGVKGYSSTAIGVFWSVAVIAEITYFAFSNKVLSFCSPLSIVMFSSVCAAARWALFSDSDAVPVILLGQCLHALSFAAYHSAIMRCIRDHAPPDIQVFTQGVYYSLAVALPMGLATPFAGYLYETQPQWSWYVMALFALMGTVLAFIAHQKMRSATDATTNVYSRLL